MRVKYLGSFLAVLYAIIFLESCTGSSKDNLPERIPNEISYNFDVRPILSDKCLACHGPDANKREAGLRLDIAEEAYRALKENPSAHAIVPGKPELSQMYLRISTTDTSMQMPPKSSNLRLSAYEIDLLKAWIKQGAKYEKHWAFTVPKKPALPAVKKEGWSKNEIDLFILARQEQKGLSPNEEADQERLLKRLSLDLTGLPPTLAMMDGFVANQNANAYEKVVDKLLASPEYGERMALPWLDVARYSDSYGYQMDNYRSQWPWRDWVIHALNKNISYKDFITWQLAGDLIPNANKEQLLATGFNRNHKITEEGAVDEEEYRITYVTDRSDTFGKALLGVTMECAHCHDHKYDPFSQKEYYQMFSFFNNVNEMRATYTAIDPSVGKPESFAKKPMMEISNEDVKSILKFVNKPDTSRLIVSVMGDLDTTRKTYVLKRGVFNAYGDQVQPGTPKSILPFDPKYPKNRLGLAQWLFDKRNPLTARVFVNRMWQEFFGRGIVKTSGDFGMQGELPTHPALLDWLAVDFMEHNWDMKRLVKQVVMSATYRQSVVVTPEKRDADPENIYLARSPRYRIQAEFIKDLVLSSSGLLVKTIGGPSVKPYQPEGLWESATAGGDVMLSVYRQDHGASLYRRGMYTFVKRTVPPPSMGIFDASNRDLCEISRQKTNTPLQALVMMNDPTVLEASRVLADRLLSEKSETKAKITKAFRMIICRTPTDKEIAVLTEYYAGEAKSMNIKQAERLLSVGEYPQSNKADKKLLVAMMRVISTIYNLEEAITKT
ncbi:PSD1 and planctomycete cytochrome C domain-containing protein [Dyadobacter arcticus]|nr:PSD1 and planctomycete cytochrome C domain-containing protein [Dyadobacter arcticus]